MDLFCEDIENERLHFPNLNTVFDDAEDNNDIDLNQFINFIKKLKSEFEDRFTDFKKIENVVQILNNCFYLHPNGLWSSEATSVFGSNIKLPYRWR
ncbi:unnamed protein product [Macrosiphum euphorbiae]|uniref:Bromo domain-containing protein n=1 Tax=Macrosiphum euphorbiae TaxID=13131 RepID=A0AAV0VW34_9HEMI|nr:unnamed protein product [Macrosiphum euphorbiae]